MAENDFLGKGMKFPPTVNLATGRFEVSEGTQNIKESIYIILMTQRGARFMRPGFGSTILSYTFMDTSSTMMQVMIRELQDTILSQEPRIEKLEINIDSKSKQGCLIVNLSYSIIGANVTDNMVFPFYLNAAKESDVIEL